MFKTTCLSASLSALVAIATTTACGLAGSAPGSSDDPKGSPPPGSFGSTKDGTLPPGAKPCIKDGSFYDVPGDNCDNDDDGQIDNPPSCDADLAERGSAEEIARAIGICDRASDKGYGLVSARFTRGYQRTEEPAPEQHGVLGKFGNVIRPREGERLAVISTGYAQEFNGAPDAAFGGSSSRDWHGAVPGGTGSAPPGFPKGAENCPQSMDVNDVIDVKLELKAPKNASGFKFDFNFHSAEWPAFICSDYNDGFIAYLSAASYNGGKPDNISFDARKNPVSVNNGFFDRCTPGVGLGCQSPTAGGKSKCPGGPAELAGTGFGIIGDACGQSEPSTLGGATGWLSSTAPIQAEETFTLELVLWDTGDGILDSSVLLDNFYWLAGQVTTSTERPEGPR